jgi:uncharacterized protein (DUF1330 family)
MAAFVIAEIQVTDPVKYKEYVETVPATIATFGGRYVARGGRVETLEGEHQPERLVVVEFDSIERAKAWWSSEEYRAPKLIRQSSARARIILVEGV